ncbi:1-phosphofructokinase [Ectobacillus funiculus]|uniref:1-phosphofructokinase n=1 Tax=Ectobacillus funiculus TaxID=137993 RepID=UPI00397D83EA
MIGTITLNPSVDIRYTVEEFSIGSVTRVKQVERTAGGKGLNVSRVATLVGEQVQATGFLGGASGDFIRSEIKKSDIFDAFVQIQGETRSCHNIMGESVSSTELLEPGPYIDSQALEVFHQTYESMLSECKVITASGSLPQGIPQTYYNQLITKANEKGVRFLLDTSGEGLKAAVAAKPFFLKPNHEELEILIGKKVSSEQDIHEALQMLYDKGISFCVISMGKKGSMAIVDGEKYRVTFPAVQAVNTVGSGDSFVAGIAVALSRGYNVEETLAFASACGTANALESQTGFVQQETVDFLKQQVKVEKII